MAGRNLTVNRTIVPPHMNDFRHELFTMSWKPIMLFKLDRVGCMNVTPTSLGEVGEHTSLFDLAPDLNEANLLLDLHKDGRDRTYAIKPVVSVDSGTGVTVQSNLGNEGPFGHSSLPHNQEQPKNTSAGTSKVTMASSLTGNLSLIHI